MDPRDQDQPEQGISEPDQEAEDLFDADDGDEEDLMDDGDGDVASSDSELQVEDPAQEGHDAKQEEQDQDPMRYYYEQENAVLQWLANNPGQRWVDKDFPPSNAQFYEDTANLPPWGQVFKNLEWRRPDELVKDPKFMMIFDEKGPQIDAKHGLFGASHFVSALTMGGNRGGVVEKLIVEKQYFDRGFVSFQFFKNGRWTQVIVDTLLPYEKEQNSRVCCYSSCGNLQQFWIQLMEKAYAKLHHNYERTTNISVLDTLVDLTGGIAELVSFHSKFEKKDPNAVWNLLHTYLSQKFLLGATNLVQDRSLKQAQQGQQGILQNHYYAIMDMRDFPKDNLKLVRLRNPWGSEGVWTGPFCEEADDWEKYKAVKEDVKNAPKLKKADGSWWMSFTDFLTQFERVAVGKMFPEAWEVYSIESQWNNKTNGGRCPTGLDKTHAMETKDAFKQAGDHLQPESDDRWFNNPQFRLKINKDTKIYMTLMLEDDKLSGQPYVPCGFMVAVARSKTERFWQRPPENDILAEVNYHSQLPLQRQITQFFNLKKGDKGPGIYIIVPNINETKEAKDALKKDETRKFFLRLFTPDSVDVSELSQTLELTVESSWTESSAGGSRKIELKQDANGKKKGDMKDNPGWCKNPQYLVSIKQPTLAKVILRRGGNKKYKGWKIGMTICRYPITEERKLEKDPRQKKNAGHNLQRLIQQTSEFLKPAQVEDVQRKLLLEPNEKFKESAYLGEECSALLFKWNPTEGPFVLVPSSDGEERIFPFRLTIFSNNPVEMIRLDEAKNQVAIGRWEKDISAGGCHLNEKEKEASQRTWSMNPKYLLSFKDLEYAWEEPVNLKITLSIAEKQWKKLNPNTVSGMIGIYLLEKREGKLLYSPEVVVEQTSFLPVKTITLETTVGGERPILKGGYLIMPSTYESKVQGSFILSVKCDRPFDLTQAK